MSENSFIPFGIPCTIASGIGPVGHTSSASTTITPTVATLVYMLVNNYFKFTFTAIKCHVTTVGTSSNVIRMGIYKVNQITGLPSELILDAGTVSTTGSTGEKSISISQTLQGPFYMAYVSQTGTTAVFRGPAATTDYVNSCFYGRINTLSSSTHYRGFTDSGSITGALPSTPGSLTLLAADPIAMVMT